MRRVQTRSVIACLALCLVVSLLGACAKAEAQADPMEVTYYYLPT